MTDIIDRAKSAMEGITPGEWHTVIFAPNCGEGEAYAVAVVSDDLTIYEVQTLSAADANINEANARFIAAAPGLVRELIAEVERLRAGVRVKPLVWVHHDAVDDLGFMAHDEAKGIGGYYNIEHQDGGHFCLWLPEALKGTRFPTLAAAKAAAQADYEARILAALEGGAP